MDNNQSPTRSSEDIRKEIEELERKKATFISVQEGNEISEVEAQKYINIILGIPFDTP